MPRDDDHHGQAFIGLVATTRPDTSADATRMEGAGMIQTTREYVGHKVADRYFIRLRRPQVSSLRRRTS